MLAWNMEGAGSVTGVVGAAGHGIRPIGIEASATGILWPVPLRDSTEADRAGPFPVTITGMPRTGAYATLTRGPGPEAARNCIRRDALPPGIPAPRAGVGWARAAVRG